VTEVELITDAAGERAARAGAAAGHYVPVDEATFLPVTRSLAVGMQPSSWIHVASFFRGLLEREPMRSSPGWEHERVVLGALATDLEYAARSHGEPEAYPMDLRTAAERQRDRHILDRIAASRHAHRRLVEAQEAALAAPAPSTVTAEPLPTSDGAASPWI